MARNSSTRFGSSKSRGNCPFAVESFGWISAWRICGVTILFAICAIAFTLNDKHSPQTDFTLFKLTGEHHRSSQPLPCSTHRGLQNPHEQQQIGDHLVAHSRRVKTSLCLGIVWRYREG
jgi:hypothetical protein